MVYRLACRCRRALVSGVSRSASRWSQLTSLPPVLLRDASRRRQRVEVAVDALLELSEEVRVAPRVFGALYGSIRPPCPI